MTKKQLHQIYYLKREISMWEKELKEADSKSYINGQEISDMPRGSGTSDKVANRAVDIAEYELEIKKAINRCIKEKIIVMKYINGIDDSMMRMIMFLRHVSLLPWNVVADEVGGDNTEDSVRMAHDRFIENN